MTYSSIERKALVDACSRACGGQILGTPADRWLGGISDETLTDFARGYGIMSVCLGCGTVHAVEGGISVPEADRAATARAYADAGMLDCCPDADSILL